MYTKEQLEVIKVFSTRNAYVLFRNNLNSVSDVRNYLSNHPYETCKKYHAIYYRGIGDTKYKEIVTALNTVK